VLRCAISYSASHWVFQTTIYEKVWTFVHSSVIQLLELIPSTICKWDLALERKIGHHGNHPFGCCMNHLLKNPRALIEGQTIVLCKTPPFNICTSILLTIVHRRILSHPSDIFRLACCYRVKLSYFVFYKGNSKGSHYGRGTSSQLVKQFWNRW